MTDSSFLEEAKLLKVPGRISRYFKIFMENILKIVEVLYYVDNFICLKKISV